MMPPPRWKIVVTWKSWVPGRISWTTSSHGVRDLHREIKTQRMCTSLRFYGTGRCCSYTEDRRTLKFAFVDRVGKQPSILTSTLILPVWLVESLCYPPCRKFPWCPQSSELVDDCPYFPKAATVLRNTSISGSVRAPGQRQPEIFELTVKVDGLLDY
jgi:hypothetical protein